MYHIFHKETKHDKLLLTKYPTPLFIRFLFNFGNIEMFRVKRRGGVCFTRCMNLCKLINPVNALLDICFVKRCVYITVCPNGNFISNKSCVDCPGHCKNGASCNKLTGMCDNGCANHWNGTFCNSMYQ